MTSPQEPRKGAPARRLQAVSCTCVWTARRRAAPGSSVSDLLRGVSSWVELRRVRVSRFTVCLWIDCALTALPAPVPGLATFQRLPPRQGHSLPASAVGRASAERR